MKKLIMLMAVAAFCFSMAGIAGAEISHPTSDALQPTPTKIFQCPAGWQKLPTQYVCVPTKPAPITCPKGYVYFERLTCAPAGGVGCQVGCEKPVPR